MWASATGRFPTGPIGPVGRQRVPHVGHGDDAGLERNVAADEPARVALAVHPLVVVEDHGSTSRSDGAFEASS